MAIQKAPFRPVATPISTVGRPRIFQRGPRPVAPARPQAPAQPQMPSPAPALEANSLYQLGQVLSDLSPKLREFYMTRQKQQAELDLAAGQQAALEADGVSSWAEAVSSGVVSPNASPWFQRGFKQRLGRNLALQAQLELMDRYSKSEIRASTDATAIQEFLRENLKEIVGEVDDPLVREGLTPEVDRIVNQMVALHVQNSSTNARAKSVEQLGIAVGLVVDEAVAAAQRTGGKLDYDSLIARVHAEEEAAMAEGIPGTKINEEVARVISSKMEEHGLVGLARVANADRVRQDGKKVPGSGRTRTGMALIQSARDALFSKQVQLENLEYQRWVRWKDFRKDELMGQALNTLLADPYAQVDPAIAGELRALDPTAFMTLQGYQDRLINTSDRMTGVEAASLYRRLAENPTYQNLAKLAAEYGLTDERVGRLEQVMRVIQEQGDPFEDDVFTEYKRMLSDTVKAWYTGPFNIIKDNQPVVDARTELDRLWIEAVSSNLELLTDLDAKQQWMEKTVRGVIERHSARRPGVMPTPTEQQQPSQQPAGNADASLPSAPLFNSAADLDAAIEATKAGRPNALVTRLQELGIVNDPQAVAEFIQTQRELLRDR